MNQDKSTVLAKLLRCRNKQDVYNTEKGAVMNKCKFLVGNLTLGEEESSLDAGIADVLSPMPISVFGKRFGGSGAFLFIFFSGSCRATLIKAGLDFGS